MQKPRSYLIFNLEAQTQSDTLTIINTFQTENILTFYVGETLPWKVGGRGGVPCRSAKFQKVLCRHFSIFTSLSKIGQKSCIIVRILERSIEESCKETT